MHNDIKLLVVALLIAAVMGGNSFQTAGVTRAALKYNVIAPQLLVPFVLLQGFLMPLHSINKLMDGFIKQVYGFVNNFVKNARNMRVLQDLAIFTSIRGPTSTT